MEKRSPLPRLFPNVLQALYDLGETGGSTLAKIVEHVKESLNSGNSTPPPRNISAQIQRALTTAVGCKIVRQRAGKYSINSSQEMPPDCIVCRRRRSRHRKKGGHGRRRRRSRQANLTPSDSEADSGTDYSEEDESRSVSRSRSRSRSGSATSSKRKSHAYVTTRSRRRRRGSGKATKRRRRSRKRH